MTQSACGSSPGLRPMSAVGTTFESRRAKSVPSAPGPMTATGKRAASSLRAIEALEHLVLHPEALALTRKAARADLRRIARDRVLDRSSGLGVALDERGREPGEHPDHVVEHQHLAVAVGTGPDADRRN